MHSEFFSELKSETDWLGKFAISDMLYILLFGNCKWCICGCSCFLHYVVGLFVSVVNRPTGERYNK